jgi:hypothetical protein
MEEERRRYSQQLAAYTLQQWNLARENRENSSFPDKQGISNAPSHRTYNHSQSFSCILARILNRTLQICEKYFIGADQKAMALGRNETGKPSTSSQISISSASLLVCSRLDIYRQSLIMIYYQSQLARLTTLECHIIT